MDSQGFLPQLINSVIPAANLETSTNILSGWHASLIILQRQNCILWVHDTTCFAIFTPCLKIPSHLRARVLGLALSNSGAQLLINSYFVF